jgi:N-acetylmuramoyl-L-alanine amidase
LIAAYLTSFGINANAYTVVVDPGHGGSDRGATQGTIIESGIALNVAQKLAEKFKDSKTTKIILTRGGDLAVSLKQRTKIAELKGADLFVSLHGNSSTDRRAKGAEFYIGTSKPSHENSQSPTRVDRIVSELNYNARLFQSQYLATDTFRVWQTSPVSKPRAVRQAPFYVINKNSVPSILVEFGFITHAQESQELLKDETQDAIAENLRFAIEGFRKNSIKK